MTAARSTRRSLLLSLTLALALLGSLAHQAPCQAGLVMRLASDVTATAGSSGSFDVVLFNDPTASGTASANISSYSLRLSLLGLSGVSFTGVQLATSGTFTSANTSYSYSSYIFRQGVTSNPYNSPLSYDTFPNTSFAALDSEFDPAGSRTVNSGDVYGLVRVSYTVAASASAGSGQLAFDSQPGGYSLADENAQQVSVSAQNGTFTINAGGVVPAPGSLVLGLIGLGTGGLARLARRGRRLVSVA